MTKLTTTMIASAIGLLLSTHNVQAAETAFIGPAIGINVSAQQTTLDRDPAWPSNLTGNSTSADLTGSWGFDLSPQWVGTVGLSIALNNPEVFKDSSSGSTATATSKQHIVISFAPGYRLTANSLAYAKASLHSMDVQYKDSALDVTKTHQGYGLGAGYAYALNKNIELRTELEWLQFDGQNTTSIVKLTPKQMNLSLGIAYKF